MRLNALASAALGSLALAACAETRIAQPEAARPAAGVAGEAIARAAANTLFTRLTTELSAAMQSGGPVAAVEVCKVRAPAIAAEIEAETGVDIERTALKVRNPANAPTAWERQTMEAFVARHAAGEPWPAMETSRVENGVLQWMKPIPMGAMCAVCHGSDEVAPETAAAIAAAYPADAARGFAPGELRGAFTARIPAPSQAR
jgi:hypothetical protein